MPQRKRIFLKAVLLPLGLLAMAAAIFRRKPDAWEYEQIEEEVAVEPPASAPPAARRRQTKRYALAVSFSALFFAGAAFTAGAGDQMVRLMDEDAAALRGRFLVDRRAGRHAPDAESAAPEAAPEAAPADAAPAEAAPAEAAAPEAAPAEAAPAETPADTAPAEAAMPSAEAAPSTAAAQAAEPAAEAAAAAPAPAPSTATAGRTGPEGRRCCQAVHLQARAGGEGEPGEEVGRQARFSAAGQGPRGRGRTRR